MASNEKECVWCGATDGCDCVERMECPNHGKTANWSCGTKECGHPRFVPCLCMGQEARS